MCNEGEFYLKPKRGKWIRTFRAGKKFPEGQKFIQNVEGFIGADKKTSEGGRGKSRFPQFKKNCWRIRLCLTSRKKTFHSASRSE